MKNRVFTLLILTLLATTSINVNAVNVRGGMSCEKWAEVQKKHNNYNVVRAWLFGLLSGIAITSGKDILAGTDNESLFLWVDNYCHKFPLKDIYEAGNYLANELAQKKGLGKVFK